MKCIYLRVPWLGLLCSLLSTLQSALIHGTWRVSCGEQIVGPTHVPTRLPNNFDRLGIYWRLPLSQARAIKAVLLEWRLTHSPQPQREREERTRESERWSALVVRCSSSLALPSFSSASVTVVGVPLSPTFTPVRYNPSSSALLFFLVNSPQFPLLHTPHTGASVLLMMVDSAFHLSQSNKKLLISGSTRIQTEFSRLRSHFLTCPRPYNFDAS